MNPSQNFFWGAWSNEPQSFRYHSPRPGWRIEYHMAEVADLPRPQCSAARLAVGASSNAPTARIAVIERMTVSSARQRSGAARAPAMVAMAPRVTDPDRADVG